MVPWKTVEKLCPTVGRRAQGLCGADPLTEFKGALGSDIGTSEEVVQSREDTTCIASYHFKPRLAVKLDWTDKHAFSGRFPCTARWAK